MAKQILKTMFKELVIKSTFGKNITNIDTMSDHYSCSHRYNMEDNLNSSKQKYIKLESMKGRTAYFLLSSRQLYISQNDISDIFFSCKHPLYSPHFACIGTELLLSQFFEKNLRNSRKIHYSFAMPVSNILRHFNARTSGYAI